MKKNLLTIVGSAVLCVLMMIGCSKPNGEAYAFTDISWTRTTEYDTETIHFDADGGYGYSCGCGNPVNDADLCEGYTYDDETKTITLNCTEEVPGMVTVIKVVACDGETLQLDFDGEIRVFEKEE